jgi:hypothetical protein
MFDLPAGNRPDDEEGLCPRRDRFGQRRIWRFMGEILLAGEEPQKRSALLRDVFADRAAQHWIAGLQRVENRALRGRALDLELHFAANARQSSQMWRE